MISIVGVFVAQTFNCLPCTTYKMRARVAFSMRIVLFYSCSRRFMTEAYIIMQ